MENPFSNRDCFFTFCRDNFFFILPCRKKVVYLHSESEDTTSTYNNT